MDADGGDDDDQGNSCLHWTTEIPKLRAGKLKYPCNSIYSRRSIKLQGVMSRLQDINVSVYNAASL